MPAVDNTYNRVGNREDLTDIITIISATETPMLTEFAKTTANGTYHEWQTVALADAAANAQIEGFSATFASSTANIRVGNYTQILSKTIEVSRTQERVLKAGRKSEVAFQTELRMKELARDIEYTLVNGTGDAGGTSARVLKGTVSFTTTNQYTAGSAASAYTALTVDHYNALLQVIFEAGGKPTTAYVGGFQKRKISAFTPTGATRNVSTDDKRLVANVDVFESDFGLQEIILDRYAVKNTLLLLDKSLWRVAFLDQIKMEPLAKIGDSKRAMMVAELTLEALNEQSGGKIINLTTS